jgi:hypothetical protein
MGDQPFVQLSTKYKEDSSYRLGVIAENNIAAK